MSGRRSCWKGARISGQDPVRLLFANGQVDRFPLEDMPRTTQRRKQEFGFYVQKGLFEEYARFGRGEGQDLPRFRPATTKPAAACAGR
jgi:hypothetical protein